MCVNENQLATFVTMITGQGEVNGTGLMVAYYDAPTVGLQMPNGIRANWRADLTRPATLEEIVAIARDAISKTFNSV